MVNESWISGNDSNGTGHVQEDPVGFGYYSLFISIFFIVPVATINILLLVSIITAKTIPVTIRLVLANIVLACLVLIAGIFGIFMITVFLSGFQYLPQSEAVCRMVVILIVCGSSVRLLHMGTFASVLYLLVHHGRKRVKFTPAAVATVLMWLLATVPHLMLGAQPVLGVIFLEGTDCFPIGVGAVTYVYVFSCLTFYGGGSFSISTVMAVMSLRYIRKNTITKDTKLLKAMLKFSVFLLFGNGANFIGITVPFTVSAFYPLYPEDHSATITRILSYVEGVFILLSLLPAPIFMLVYVRPVQQRLKHIICPCCATKADTSVDISTRQQSTTLN